jgi:hypothetical protein
MLARGFQAFGDQVNIVLGRRDAFLGFLLLARIEREAGFRKPRSRPAEPKADDATPETPACGLKEDGTVKP